MATNNELGKVIYNLLSNNSGVYNLAHYRIYPITAPQNTTFPFVVYTITNTEPSLTKDGVSPLDVISFQIDCYSTQYDENTSLANAVRSALDYYTGTVEGQQIQRIRFVGEGDGDYNAELEIFWKSLDFSIRLKRER
jgi:hypothetical protein